MSPDLREMLRGWLADNAVRGLIAAGDYTGLQTLTAFPPLAPRVVTVAAAVVTAGAHVGDPRCPDCNRGLSSRGTDLYCPQLPRSTTLTGVLATGRVVACGVPNA